MYSFGLRVFAALSLLGSLSAALPHSPNGVSFARNPTTMDSRSTNTCADPTLAQTVYQAFNGGETAHLLAYIAGLETVNTKNGEILWGDLHPAFNAWPTQQEFTLPLFQLEATTTTQYIYLIGTNASTPPNGGSGFTRNIAVVAWVYNTQICGSVPLMSAAFAATSDTYYTIDPFVHASLLAEGWVDDGVVAYVLPLYNS